jgi:hypothetical protein
MAIDSGHMVKLPRFLSPITSYQLDDVTIADITTGSDDAREERIILTSKLETLEKGLTELDHCFRR